MAVPLAQVVFIVVNLKLLASAFPIRVPFLLSLNATCSNDGRLQAVPNLGDAYYNELDTTNWGLVPVAQLESYKGLFFATFDPDAAPLQEYLGEFT